MPCRNDGRSDLKEKVMMIMEPRLSTGCYEKYLRRDGSLILDLNKALYGLGESAKLWYDNIRERLILTGFTASCKDPCIFV
jgi:hypothetical protein